jgi:hypothetical protein
MTTFNELRVHSIDGPFLTFPVNHNYGWDWNYYLAPSRSLALQFLCEPLWQGREIASRNGIFLTKEQADDQLRTTPLGKELPDWDEFYNELWIPANVGRFVSCVGVVDRQHCDEMWNNSSDKRWGETPNLTEAKETPKATFNIAVTDPKWSTHLSPGLEWDSAGYCQDAKIVINPAWLTSTVLALARQMYDSRDFSAMPILADALQDAGCDNEDILKHCRGPGPHVRGCWVLGVGSTIGKAIRLIGKSDCTTHCLV